MKTYRAHCLILPHPIQGHINPMLQFSKRLQNQSIKITLAATKFLFKTIQDASDTISVYTISDGFDEVGFKPTENSESYFHTFQREVDWMTQILPVMAVGPTIASMYLDKRLKEDNAYGMNLFQPMTDACITWLNQRSEESVIYLSFGSVRERERERRERDPFPPVKLSPAEGLSLAAPHLELAAAPGVHPQPAGGPRCCCCCRIDHRRSSQVSVSSLVFSCFLANYLLQDRRSTAAVVGEEEERCFLSEEENRDQIWE
ncbi:hypothetical protein M9H77_25256 [Catharanthus roseus]|uniref:Uncharacterized protein n=1 Tax=Catharanthus roseus TaxID=4058 RepID=A0ACC0A8Y5_CATRO|nr:hypothetical protein M9H77_25256 [Catharanthus roseus]